MTSKNRFSTTAFFILVLICSSCDKKKVFADKIYEKPELIKNPPITFLSPEESLKTMYLPEGYHMELVASEPMINEPVTMAWGPDGKLYVAEMLTYMQDIDGTDENEPWSRVSMLEDTDGDGKMDKSTVFIDSLVLPRVLLPLDDRVIVGQTYDRSLYSYKDTNGDGVADEKILVFEDSVRDNANLEHQSASMIWSIDNWLYLSSKSLRYRFTNNKMEVDTLYDAPNGQWGLTQDENGQIYYSSAGGEDPALGYQQHPTYGELDMPGNREEGFEKVWPIIGTPDVQGGIKRLREDGTLNHFTASCGQSIFLGDNLPVYGDLFIPEPVGRLIRRAKVNNEEGKTVLANAYDKTEFLASTDPNFRPVETKTGPDGCLYVVDMYRGIIQEGAWVGKGSFLRPVIERKGFDKNIGKGRIYRIVHEEMEPSIPVNLLAKSSKELIPYLFDPNGWYRMNAQKLLVLKHDPSVIPELKEIVELDDAPFWGSLFSDQDYTLGRLHALWTLEGLDAADPALIIQKLNDKDPRVRRAALRISERYLKNDNKDVLVAVANLQDDPDIGVLQQVELTLRFTKDKKVKNEVVGYIMDNNKQSDVLTVVGMQTIEEVAPQIELIKKKFVLESSGVRGRLVEGYKNYKNICAACHGADGMGTEGIAPPLVGSPRVIGDLDVTLKILMNGLTGPIDGKEYAGVMVGMKNEDDDWMADVATYIRKYLNNASPVMAGHASGVREQVKDRKDYWTIEELTETAK